MPIKLLLITKTSTPSKAMQIGSGILATSVALLSMLYLLILLLTNSDIEIIFNFTLITIIIGAVGYLLLKDLMIPVDIVKSGLGFMALLVVQSIGMGILFIWMIFSAFS